MMTKAPLSSSQTASENGSGPRSHLLLDVYVTCSQCVNIDLSCYMNLANQVTCTLRDDMIGRSVYSEHKSDF